MASLKSSILTTVNWFDNFDFPLTAWEVHKYLWKHTASYQDVVTELEYIHELETTEGFWHLAGRKDVVLTRKSRYLLAERKFKKALKVLRIIRMLPWVRMIAVCNTLGYSNAAHESDIDIFVVTQNKRIWITRLFVVGFLKVFGLRPILERFSKKPENRKDKIDASFFITESALDLSPITIGDDDIYLCYWIMQLVPVYDDGNHYQKLIKSNAWVRDYLPQFLEIIPSYRREIKKTYRWPQLLGAPAQLLFSERVSKWFQSKLLPQQISDRAHSSTGVVISDSMLKFHDKDPRIELREQFVYQTDY